MKQQNLRHPPFDTANIPSVKRYLTAILTIGLSALFLYFAIRGISWQEVSQTFHKVKIQYILLGLVINTVSLLLRSLRWRNLISARKSISAMTLFWATSVGYLGNTFLPGRIGEVIRSVALGDKAGINKSFVFATALTERVLDAFILVIASLFLLPTISRLPENLLPFVWAIGAFSGVIILTFMFSSKLYQFVFSILTHFHLPKFLFEKISSFAEQFSLGAAAFAHPVRAGIFLSLTMLIWLLDSSGAVVIANGMGIRIALGQAILFLVVLALASALPSTPGYVGIYQITATLVLPAFGFTRGQSLTYIIILQLINMMVVLLCGSIGLLRLGINLRPTKVIDPV